MLPVHDYYDQLAVTYDQDRFGSSYGRYVDQVERRVLRRWLHGHPPEAVVDLGCGTGRFLDFARTGVDSSAAMLAQAAAKHPDRKLVHADITATGLPGNGYTAALCFHVLMHLEPLQIEAIFREAARLVAPRGLFIFDVPSQPRRNWGRRQGSGWHGNTAATLDDLKRWAGTEWQLARWRGLLWVPIHRLPSTLRPAVMPFDSLLGRSPLARWSSYYLCAMERRG